jgi:hypothetical protein
LVKDNSEELNFNVEGRKKRDFDDEEASEDAIEEVVEEKELKVGSDRPHACFCKHFFFVDALKDGLHLFIIYVLIEVESVTCSRSRGRSVHAYLSVIGVDVCFCDCILHCMVELL